jgi:acetyl-CoA acetyltransferase
MAEASHAALAAAALEVPDAIVVATMNPEEFLGDGNFASHVATHMGFAEVPTLRVETATSSGAAAFYIGFAEVAAGLHRRVLVVGGEKMTHLATPRVSELIGRSIDPYERSYGATMPALAVRHRTSLTAFRATQEAARAAYAMAGFGPERVDFAELHDAFSPFELIALEDTGLVPPGKAGHATLDGDTSLDGRIPINPSGGLKAKGHPLGATGAGQVVEIFEQLHGKAGERQAQGAEVALTHNVGGSGASCAVHVFERGWS